MYGRIKEDKLRTNKIDFSVQSVKSELEVYIDNESKRVNIDSAKKRAVTQGMDYEGFRQMVLGAHLFKLKSKELTNLNIDRTNKQTDIVLNSSLTTFNNIVDLGARQNEEIQQANLRIAEMLASNELKANTFREFKKNFDSYYQENMDDTAAQNIYLIFKSQKEENFKKIFSLDFDVSYFIKILRVMTYIIKESLLPNKNRNELLFLMNFLHQMSTVKDFQFSVPKFLSSKEKTELKSFMQYLKESATLIFQAEEIKESASNIQEIVEQSPSEEQPQSEEQSQSEEQKQVSQEECAIPSKEIQEKEQESHEDKKEEKTETKDNFGEDIVSEILQKLESYYIK